MDINLGIVILGIACTGIGLWFGWLYYHGKVGLLRLEIQVLRGELADEKARGEACGKAADEWRCVALRHVRETEELKHELEVLRQGIQIGQEAAELKNTVPLFLGYWRDASDLPDTDGSYLIRTATGWAEAEYRKGRGWYQYRWGVTDPEILKWCDVVVTRLGG
jgi:hypothetical protein